MATTTPLRPSSDITTTSNTASDITGMVHAVAANTTYFFFGYIHIGCNNTGGVKFTLTIPSGATVYVNFQGSTTNNTTYGTFNCITSGTLIATAFCQENQSGRGVIVSGTVTTGSTAGNVQFQFASGTNTQTSTVFKEGTCVYVGSV